MTGSSRAVTGFTLKVLNDAESSTITSLSDQPSKDSANKEPHRLITFQNPVGHPWTLRSSDIVVGRSPPGVALTTSTAMFRCPVVSRKHAKFAFYDGKLFLCDTESHHGTHIYRPGVSSTSTKLVPYNELQVNDGDVITFGKTVRNRELVKPVVVKVELFLDDLTEGARLEASSEDAYKESVAKAPITPITPTPALINVASTSTSTNTTPKSGTGRYGVFSPSSSESEGSSSSCEHSDEMDISSDSSASDASDDDDEVEEIPAPKPVHASASPASIAFKMLKSIGGGSFTSSGSGSGSGSPISSMHTPASWWNIGNGAAPPPLPPPEPTTKPPPQPPTPPFMQSRTPAQTPFMFGSAAASQTHTPFTFGLGLGMGMGGMGLPRFFDPNGPGGSASAASIPRDVDENVCVTLPPLNLGPGSGFGGGEEGEGGDENENEGDHDDGLSSVFAVSGSAGASPSPSPYSQSPFVNPAASTSPSVAHATSSLFATSASPSMIALQRFKRMQKRMKLRELFTFKGFGNPSGSKEKGTGRSRSKSPMSMSVSESASTPSSPTIPSSFPEEQEQQQTGTSSIQCAQLRDGDVDIDAGVGGGPDNDGAGTLSVPVDYFADPIECGFGLDLDLDLDPWRVDPFAVGGVEDQEQDVPRDKGKGKAIVIDVEENRGAEDVDDEVDEDEDDEDEDEDEDDEDEDDDVEFIGMGQSQEEQDSLFTDSVFARGAKLLPNATPATPAKSDPSTSSLPSTSAPPPTTKDDDSTADFIKAQLAINNSVADRLDTIQAKRKGIDDEINARDKKINDLIQGHRRDSDGIRASLHTIEEAFEKYQGGVKEIREDMEVGMEDMKGGLQEFRLELGGVGGRLGDVEDRVERLGVVRDRVDRLLERMDGVEMRVMEGDKVLRDGVGEAREQMGQMKRRVEGLEFDGEVWKAQTDEGKRLVEELRAAFERMQTEHQHLSEARESLKSEMRSVVEMRTRMEVLEEEWKAAIKSQMSTRLPLKRKRTDGSDDDYADDEDESTPSSKRIALDATIDQQITTPSPVSVPVPATNGDVQMTTSSLPRRSRIGRKIARTATTLVVGAAVTWTALAFS